MTAWGEPRPLPHYLYPPLPSTPDADIHRITGRIGDGRIRQTVVKPVKAMGSAVYVPKTCGVEEGYAIEVPDVAGEGQGMITHGLGLWQLLQQRRIG